MGIAPRVAIVTFLFSAFALVRSEESDIRSMPDDQLLKQVTEKAPYFKHKVDLYLRRLWVDDNPAPLVRELNAQLRHFCPSAGSPLSLLMPSEKRPLKNDRRSPEEVTPFKVNNADSACWHVSVAFSDLSNQFLVIWQDERHGANNPDIYGQYFNQSLQAIGSNFRVHSENSGAAQSTPAVAATSDGGFVVAWEDYRNGRPTIFYRGFGGSHAAKGEEAEADASQSKDQYFPAITADNLGFFTIAWLQDDDGDFNIYSRKFDNSGQAQRVSFKVNTDYQYLQWAPAVASAVTGETLIAWEDKRNGNSDIFGQRMRADGTRQAGNFKINDADGGTTQWRPFVAAQAGQFVVCWEDYQQHPNAICAQWFDSSLLTVGANVRIDDGNEAGLKEYPTVAIDDNKKSLFAWQDGRNGNWDIYVGWCNADRLPQDVSSLNAEPANADQTQPKVIIGDSLPTFVWLSQLGTGEKQHVFAAQYDWTVVPVELAAFAATVEASDVHLEWVTMTESNNFGFEIQRKTQDEDFEKIAFVSGSGTTTSGNSYSYIDKGLFPGAYTYRLKQIDYNGEHSFSNFAEVVVQGPSQFHLSQNYPNPFNSETEIAYQLNEDTHVTFRVLNLLGQEIRTLIDEEKSAGYFKAHWDGKDEIGGDLPNGLYIYCIQAGRFANTKKMLLLR